MVDFKHLKASSIEELAEAVGTTRRHQRRRIRYMLFRLQNEASGGCAAPKQEFGKCIDLVVDFYTKKLKARELNAYSQFGIVLKDDFSSFGNTWDIGEGDEIFEVVTLGRTLLQEWHDEIEPNIKDLPRNQ